jgi:hypothetical protein
VTTGREVGAVTEGGEGHAHPGVETYRAGWHLMTVHSPDSYPGLQVVKGGHAWLEWVILGRLGQTVVARGGEEMYGYETSRGVRADGFVLRAGDRATIVEAGLPSSLAQWRIERAPSRKPPASAH